jgi:hypothetical protein
MTARPDWDGALRRRDPRELRRLLSVPIRVNKIAPGELRDEFIRKETAYREQALFALYHIPEDWPESIRWELLARHLAGRLFAGCRSIERGLGGPSRKRRLDIVERRTALFQEFKVYRDSHLYLSRKRAASEFIKKNKDRCAAVKLTTSNGFTRAYKKGAGTGA